jgi:uncharacterized Ntn-hydrolase superfamily protein
MSSQFSQIDLAATPTLQAVSSNDEQLLVQDLQNRVDEAMLLAEQQPEVAAALQAQRAAETALRSLQTANRVLNEHAKELREQMAALAGRALDALIESAASGGKTDYKQAGALPALEHKDRLTGKAIARVVEHLTPLAQIARLRAEAHALITRAKAIETAARQRAEKVLGQLRDAVSEEVVLPVDMSKGVAGALLSQASEYKRLAMEASENADRIEKWYVDKTRKDG